MGCTAHNYPMRDIGDIAADVCLVVASSWRPMRRLDKRSYRISFEKIARVLPAFKPQWDARRGAEQLYAGYRRSGLRGAPFFSHPISLVSFTGR